MCRPVEEVDDSEGGAGNSYFSEVDTSDALGFDFLISGSGKIDSAAPFGALCMSYQNEY